MGIVGMTGTGKTTKLVEIVNNIDNHRMIAIDDLDELAHRGLKGFFTAYNIDDFIFMLSNKRKFKIRCHFEHLDDYQKIFDIVWNLNNLVLIIDEINLHSDRYNISENLNNIVKRGRIKNISLIYNSQRPTDINREITSQSEFLISFRIQEPRDVSYFPKTFRSDVDKIKMLENLAVGEFVFIRGDNELLKSKINFKI